MVEVKRKPNESIGSLMRRFNRFVQQSGVLLKAKKSQFREKQMNERKEKNAAIMGLHLSELRKRLEKLGKYDDETFEEEKRKLKQELDL
jgi:ribosomal protein S21